MVAFFLIYSLTLNSTPDHTLSSLKLSCLSVRQDLGFPPLGTSYVGLALKRGGGGAPGRSSPLRSMSWAGEEMDLWRF